MTDGDVAVPIATDHQGRHAYISELVGDSEVPLRTDGPFDVLRACRPDRGQEIFELRLRGWSVERSTGQGFESVVAGVDQG